MKDIKKVTGTRDMFPIDIKKFEYVKNAFKEVVKSFAFEEYKTPMFEYTNLFQRGIGETTDIVNKEMFTFFPRKTDKESITLKPEGTASMARLYNENGLFNEKPPTKIFYVIPCFRNERNQKGRYKEFHQFGVETIGSNDPSVDAEIIIIAYRFFEKLGIMDNIELQINSVGGFESRKKYHQELKNFLKADYDNLCPVCKERFEKNPMRIIDCKEEKCQKIVANAPTMLDFLSEEEARDFEKVKKYLDIANVKYTINKNIVRGLDYYTKTAFEFVTEDIGAKNTICGGGRYDGLIMELFAKDIPGVGFGLGIERLIMTLDALNKFPVFENQYDLFIATLGDNAKYLGFEIADNLRKNNVVCDLDHMDKSLKAQMKYAAGKNAKYTLILGENEVESRIGVIKNMETSKQVEINLNNFTEKFLEILNEED